MPDSKPPFPTNYKVAYFLASAVLAAVAGGYIFKWLCQYDPLG